MPEHIVSILKENPESVKMSGGENYPIVVDLYRLSDDTKATIAKLTETPAINSARFLKLTSVKNDQSVNFRYIFDDGSIVETKTGEPVQAGNEFLRTKPRETPKEFKNLGESLKELGGKLKKALKFNDPDKIAKINEKGTWGTGDTGVGISNLKTKSGLNVRTKEELIEGYKSYNELKNVFEKNAEARTNLKNSNENREKIKTLSWKNNFWKKLKGTVTYNKVFDGRYRKRLMVPSDYEKVEYTELSILNQAFNDKGFPDKGILLLDKKILKEVATSLAKSSNKEDRENIGSILHNTLIQDSLDIPEGIDGKGIEDIRGLIIDRTWKPDEEKP